MLGQLDPVLEPQEQEEEDDDDDDDDEEEEEPTRVFFETGLPTGLAAATLFFPDLGSSLFTGKPKVGFKIAGLAAFTAAALRSKEESCRAASIKANNPYTFITNLLKIFVWNRFCPTLRTLSQHFIFEQKKRAE